MLLLLLIFKKLNAKFNILHYTYSYLLIKKKNNNNDNII